MLRGAINMNRYRRPSATQLNHEFRRVYAASSDDAGFRPGRVHSRLIKVFNWRELNGPWTLANLYHVNSRDQLLSLLIVANNKAIEKGIITEGQNLRNLISVNEIAKAISIVKENREGQFKVQLMAMNDIYRVDSFKVKFEVVPVKE